MIEETLLHLNQGGEAGREGSPWKNESTFEPGVEL